VAFWVVDVIFSFAFLIILGRFCFPLPSGVNLGLLIRFYIFALFSCSLLGVNNADFFCVKVVFCNCIIFTVIYNLFCAHFVFLGLNAMVCGLWFATGVQFGL